MNRGPPMPQFDMSDFPALGSLHNGMGSSEDSADGGKGPKPCKQLRNPIYQKRLYAKTSNAR